MSDDELSDEDKKAWREFTGEDLEDEAEEEDFKALLETSEGGLKEEKHDRAEKKPIAEPLKRKSTEIHTPQLDRRTDEKLRKGKMSIEARLDLHGMRQAEAYERLLQFIEDCVARGLRTVLVITGKGKSKSTSEDWLSPSQGVLKNNAPHWLNEASLKRHILKIYPAQPKDGGSGALYVYLKRQR